MGGSVARSSPESLRDALCAVGIRRLLCWQLPSPFKVGRISNPGCGVAMARIKGDDAPSDGPEGQRFLVTSIEIGDVLEACSGPNVPEGGVVCIAKARAAAAPSGTIEQTAKNSERSKMAYSRAVPQYYDDEGRLNHNVWAVPGVLAVAQRNLREDNASAWVRSPSSASESNGTGTPIADELWDYGVSLARRDKEPSTHLGVRVAVAALSESSSPTPHYAYSLPAWTDSQSFVDTQSDMPAPDHEAWMHRAQIPDSSLTARDDSCTTAETSAEPGNSNSAMTLTGPASNESGSVIAAWRDSTTVKHPSSEAVLCFPPPPLPQPPAPAVRAPGTASKDEGSGSGTTATASTDEGCGRPRELQVDPSGSDSLGSGSDSGYSGFDGSGSGTSDESTDSESTSYGLTQSRIALCRHRKNFHDYKAGDSLAKVAVPTPCTADHIADVTMRPVEKAFDDRADYLELAPVAEHSTRNNVKSEEFDFGLLFPPSSHTYGVSSAQTTDDVYAVLNQFLSANGLIQFDDSEYAEPPFCELHRISCSGPAMI
ncbi:hypothetical protein C8T65DRAFT_694214 [Cerioporus squamosus]|nr:hypothetical protein C8T65DRAFT_694214 [Cerioporus squamosus]